MRVRSKELRRARKRLEERVKSNIKTAKAAKAAAGSGSRSRSRKQTAPAS